MTACNIFGLVMSPTDMLPFIPVRASHVARFPSADWAGTVPTIRSANLLDAMCQQVLRPELLNAAEHSNPDVRAKVTSCMLTISSQAALSSCAAYHVLRLPCRLNKHWRSSRLEKKRLAHSKNERSVPLVHFSPISSQACLRWRFCISDLHRLSSGENAEAASPKAESSKSSSDDLLSMDGFILAYPGRVLLKQSTLRLSR